MDTILKDVVNADIINLNISAVNKEDAIRQMACMLYENDYISNVNGFICDVFKREALGITGMGNGIAIPHGESTYVNKTGISIGKLNTKIDWESLDDDKVDLIFLFCVNKDTYNKEHLKMLTEIAKKLADPELLEKLKEIDDEKEFLIRLLEG